MWANILYFGILLVLSLAEMTAPGIERTFSDGVKSVGFNVVYGSEDLTLINEVVSEVEKSTALKSRINLNDAIPALLPQDVKCLMSVDRHCSKEMGKMKGILIDALKDDCVKCSNKDKEDAGKIAASMMAHDPVAWKLFLTRSALKMVSSKNISKQKEIHLKVKGKPEEIFSRNVNTLAGYEVRVKRYAAEKDDPETRHAKASLNDGLFTTCRVVATQSGKTTLQPPIAISSFVAQQGATRAGEVGLGISMMKV